jgi:AraC-like DNA-binding protein
MLYPIKMDIIPMLRHLVESVKPFAEVNFIGLSFQSDIESQEVVFYPDKILSTLAQLLCRVITFTPSDCIVSLSAFIVQDKEGPELHVSIANSDVDLIRLYATITNGTDVPVYTAFSDAESASFYIRLPLDQEATSNQGAFLVEPNQEKKEEEEAPALFQKLRKRMQTYAISIKKLEEAVASEHSKREQVFLKKVNSLILANLDRSDFNVDELAHAMALSRTQLYRRLKPLIRFSPSRYIRFIRLQKAKEYLEQGNMSVGEVCFLVGFIDKSHFTRAFHQQFGFNPSYIRKN